MIVFVLIACQIGRGDDLEGEREQTGVNDNDKRVSCVIQKSKSLRENSHASLFIRKPSYTFWRLTLYVFKNSA